MNTIISLCTLLLRLQMSLSIHVRQSLNLQNGSGLNFSSSSISCLYNVLPAGILYVWLLCLKRFIFITYTSLLFRLHLKYPFTGTNFICSIIKCRFLQLHYISLFILFPWWWDTYVGALWYPPIFCISPRCAQQIVDLMDRALLLSAVLFFLSACTASWYKFISLLLYRILGNLPHLDEKRCLWKQIIRSPLLFRTPPFRVKKVLKFFLEFLIIFTSLCSLMRL